MNETIHKPLLVFDGDCGFCRFWINRYRHYTDEKVECSPYQEISGRFPNIPVENFRRSVHLIMPSGDVFTGAQAVFKALAVDPGVGGPLWIYENLPGAGWIAEIVYRLVAAHRPFFSFLTRLFLGKIGK